MGLLLQIVDLAAGDKLFGVRNEDGHDYWFGDPVEVTRVESNGDAYIAELGGHFTTQDYPPGRWFHVKRG